MNRRLHIAFGALLLLLLACHRPPARPRELRLVETALRATNPAVYEAAAAQLERDPKQGLAALREQSAPVGTRDALLLAALKERLSDKGRKETTLSWAERLLVSNDAVAAGHLAHARGDVPSQALAIAARTPREPAGVALRTAANALGDHGDGAVLLEAMKAWERAPLAASTRNTAARLLRGGLTRLRPSAQQSTVDAALKALEHDQLANSERAALIGAVAEIGRSESLERVARLREQASWSRDLRPELDVAIKSLLMREERDDERLRAKGAAS